MNGKIQSVEVETHQIAQNVQQMYKHSKSYGDEKTETAVRPEVDEEEIVQADIFYPINKKDDTTSQPVIFVDDIRDTIDLSGNIIAPNMQPPKIIV